MDLKVVNINVLNNVSINVDRIKSGLQNLFTKMKINQLLSALNYVMHIYY